MKIFALLLAATAALCAESPIGLSFPPGSEPVFTNDLPSIRISVPSNGEPARLANTAKENGTEIFAVIPAEEDVSKAFAATYGETVTHFEILPPAGLDPRLPNSAFLYVQRLTLAQKSARRANPKALTGISIADYDLQFLDACLRDGAVGQFDFVSLSPFPVSPGTDRLMPGALATFRKLMTLHGMPAETPVHITLTGSETQLAMTSASARAAGFDKVFIESSAETLAKIPEKNEPAPPGKSHAESPSVSLTLGETNQSIGIEQILPKDTPWDAELKANRLHISATPSVFRTAFLADPTFIDPERKTYEITVEARRLPSVDGLQNPTGLTLTYEATHGLRTAALWPVPGDNKWHTHTWKVTDARFNAKLGWHFQLDASGAGNDVLIREVKVKR
ncbi:MAG: hypothetical protein RLZZ505_1401 [Verrucomicrobiota bacterium]|jgi:hypothetical protein